jgi:2-keto-4-pentenoate hydratase/2-oxohepta-3-ene-1,7-dioic acid hydratase in catechol pathway
LRLVSFSVKNEQSYGALLEGGECVDLPRAAARDNFELPPTIDALVRDSDRSMGIARGVLRSAQSLDGHGREQARSAGLVVALSEVVIQAPIRTPSKIVAVGLNYMDHCREQKVPPPKVPLLFAKFPSSIVGPGQPIRWDRSLTQQVDFEAELAIVMGRRARRVSRETAMEYVFGYTALNDVSARDLQFSDKQWVRAKSLDTFCPIGPYLVTRDEIADPNNLAIRCQVNGIAYQNSTTAEMIFKVPELVRFITEAITLEPGDLIATGTPDGVGVFRSPQVFLKDGDDVSVEIEGIGELRNRVENF